MQVAQIYITTVLRHLHPRLFPSWSDWW